MADLSEPHILIVGAGAIGASLAGFLAPRYPRVTLAGRGPGVAAIGREGLTLFRAGAPERTEVAPVRVVADLAAAEDVDVVVFAVKTYQLAAAAAEVKAALGDGPLAVGLQNGVANQDVLPRFFPQAIYGVVCYNAWVAATGPEGVRVGYQQRGPLLLGTPAGTLQREARALALVLSLGLETTVTDHFPDAAHAKLVINLANSLTALVGHGLRPIEDRRCLQALLAELLAEGVRIVRAAGYRETRLGGLPSWNLLWALARLPQALTAPLFEWNLKKMVLSSMAQDLQRRPGGPTELDDINGYVLRLAEQTGTPAPVNRAVYELCRAAFAQAPFEPLDVATVRAAVERARAGA